MHKLKFIFSILSLILLINNQAIGQRFKIQNLPAYDHKQYHFGITLGFNEMNFMVRKMQGAPITDSLFSLQSESQLGFQIGIVSDLHLAENYNLRFTPTLSFGDRILHYRVKLNNDTINVMRPIESTFIDFPLMLKFKSARIVNTRAYLIGGFKYSLDMASLAKKKTQDNELVKLKRHDFSTELGVGFDFYLEYFKFGVELKMAYGLRDLVLRDNTLFTNSINRLNSKMFFLSFTFE